jgi:hypothetical protein
MGGGEPYGEKSQVPEFLFLLEENPGCRDLQRKFIDLRPNGEAIWYMVQNPGHRFFFFFGRKSWLPGFTEQIFRALRARSKH